jgi:hypothetical protein
MARSKAWKALERTAAKELRGKRIWRASYGEKNTDVDVPDFPSFKVDTKRYKRFQTFSLYETVKKKYCKSAKDNAILILRQWNKKTKLVVVDINFFAKLLDFVREKESQDRFN